MKKSILLLAGIYLLMYALNYFMPLCYGDDYVYSFVWTEGQKFFEPLSEDARRLSSLSDVFESLRNHYFSHAGRTIIFAPIFFFLWQGKELFNFFNAFLAVLLVVEIYWLANRGIVSLNLKPSRVAFIFFCLWTFTVGFAVIFLWLTGTLNFVWPATLVLGFLIPYVRKHFTLRCPRGKFFAVIIFFGGVLAGWTNENTICWFIILLAAQIFYQRRRNESIELWQICGLLGLILGYAFLILAPGNFVRLAEDSTMIPDDWKIRFFAKATTFFMAMLSQLFLWFFIRDTLRGAKEFGDDEQTIRSLTMAKSFAAVSLASNLIMFASPEFPMRSIFPSLIYLTVAVVILIRLQHDTQKNPMKRGAKIFLHVVGTIYFAVTLVFTLYGSHAIKIHSDRINSLAEKSSAEEILEVENFVAPDWLDLASGMHLVSIPLNKNANAWENVAYARYHKIKAIRSRN